MIATEAQGAMPGKPIPPIDEESQPEVDEEEDEALDELDEFDGVGYSEAPDTLYAYLSDRTSRLVAYRDALDKRLHEALQMVAEDAGLTAEDLKDVRVVTHKDLELAIRLTEFPPETSHHATVRTPATVDVDGVCHDCGEVTPLSVALNTKYISDAQKHEMQLTSKPTHGSHRHGQMVLTVTPDPDEADRQQSMEDVIEGQAERVEEDDDVEDEAGE